MSKSINLLLLFSLLFIFQLVLIDSSLQNFCGPGTFFLSIESPCQECYIGDYCPGDGKAYPCKPGSASSERGSVECTVCDSKRSNRDNTMCLLGDTPLDAKEITYDGKAFSLGSQGFFYVTLYSTYQGNAGNGQLTFNVEREGDFKGGIMVYGSTITGQPSSSFSMFQAIGVNATLSIPKKEDQLILLYLNIIDSNPSVRQVRTYFFPYLTNQVIMTSNKFSLQDVSYTYYQNQVLFIKDSIPIGTNVFVKFQLSNAKWVETYKLLYSTEPTQYYPNPYNADVVVTGSQNELKGFTVKQSRNGPFMFAFYVPNTAYNVGLNVELIY